jgi:Na+/H+-dicarboxylate symporter
MTKKLLKNLGFQILVAMVLGIVAGALMGESASIFAPLGEIFMKLIKMLVIPLVAVSIISGAASLGATKSAGKLGIGTFAYYMLTTAFAVILGLVLAEIFKPGIGLNVNLVKHMFDTSESGSVQQPGFWETLLGIIPDNPIQSLVSGNILQIIFFCLLFGIGVSTLSKAKREAVVKGCDLIVEPLIWMIKIVMYIAPIGVFGLMADSIGTFGFDMLVLVMKLVIVYTVAILIHLFVFYPMVLKTFSKMPIRKFFTEMFKAQMVALSTSSSMATLPVTMEVCEEKLGVSKQAGSFILPLGATINMDGTAIYYATVAIFFAQMFGIDLSMGQYIAIILTATIGSIGQAGVPGPTLLVVAVLVSADIPIIGLPLLYALDRIFDMLRTALNITGDATCAVIMDKFAHKKDN